VRRRFQKGCFTKESDGRFYSLFYADVDGKTKLVKKFVGHSRDLSERAARRQHALTMERVNHDRGSCAPILKGQTFQDAVNVWRAAIAPNLAPGTVRQRESYLRVHIIPRFGQSSLEEMDIHAIQQFATDLRKSLSYKSVVNILGTVFTTLAYAEKCGMKVAKVGFTDLEVGSNDVAADVPFFTRRQVALIIEAAQEPFKTLFAVAWSTGLRAGEILALRLDDLDFTRLTVRVNKSSDDRTREIRQPKTPRSIAMLPMTTDLEVKLRDYIRNHWTPNTGQILFPTKAGDRPRSREGVVVYGLKPILKKLGIPSDNVGLHAFRHGLATELVEAAAPLTVLQHQLRHADIKTTLKLYSHVIPESQRAAMEQVGGFSQSLLNTESLLKFARK
jgi:integrase